MIKKKEIYATPFFDGRDRIFENRLAFLIYDKFPVSQGHYLIIAKRIYSDYFQSSESEIIALNKLLFITKDYLEKNINL